MIFLLIWTVFSLKDFSESSISFTEDESNYTEMPEPTGEGSKSGVPSTGTLLGTCIACFVVMTISVTVICFLKKRTDGYTAASQILLDRKEL